MRMRTLFAAATVLTLSGYGAHAEDPTASFKANATLSRHHTSNALDGPFQLPDWYTELRGALEETLQHDLGATRISAEVQLRRYDTYGIEDDRALAIAALTTMRPSETVELRGTLSLNLVSEGDDFPIGPMMIGTRTDKAIVAAGLQAGLKLAPDTVLVLEGSASREKASDTNFQDDLLLPLRLEPDRDRLRFGATLTRKTGPFSYGAQAAAGYLRASQTDALSDISLLDYLGRLQAAVEFGNGATLAGAAGVHAIQLTNLPFSQWRPTYEMAAAMPLGNGFSLRGTLKGAYETAGVDDPLAAWIRRVEAEAGYDATATLKFGLGAFTELRDYIALDYEEDIRGVYAQASWELTRNLGLVFRVDASRNEIPALDLRYTELATQIALSAKL
ncbi:hypothetical protein [Mesorhizobium sp. CAU 1732]|uniref:hypothetical protein n=1 Tax=Mesorhizobium sp. CAU 1732 TaxID=3140358 RepID=UPI003260BB48